MNLADFSFTLPEGLISESPSDPRDASRMLVSVGDGDFSDNKVRDLPGLLLPGDMLVFNNTKVIPARVFGEVEQNSVKAEITLHKNVEDGLWQVFAKPARKFKKDYIFRIDEDFFAVVEGRVGEQILLRFNVKGDELYCALDRCGLSPLPPYIKKTKAQLSLEKDNYQTIYAKEEGAVAAPTAGLHFTEGLLDALRDKGVSIVFVTLHVGGGTFLPIRSSNIAEHKMHAEYCHIDEHTASMINEHKANGGRVVAVGTTSLRLLESVANEEGRVEAFSGETDIFITPGYKFKIVDMLMTNFHLPESTLFILICAFVGVDRAKSLYRHAIDRRYRFYSYGDACLLGK